MRKMLIVLCLVVAAGFIYFASLEKDKREVQSIEEESGIAEAVKSDVQKQDAGTSEQDLKLETMLGRFAELKEDRKKMKMRLSRLSSRLRRSEFPPDQAKTISQDMRLANYLLKDPKLLGAFSDSKEIEHEIEKLSDINVKLDAIKKLLDEKREKLP